jgi:hypothetical protein
MDFPNYSSAKVRFKQENQEIGATFFSGSVETRALVLLVPGLTDSTSFWQAPDRMDAILDSASSIKVFVLQTHKQLSIFGAGRFAYQCRRNE